MPVIEQLAFPTMAPAGEPDWARPVRVVELCAGAGGQAVGFEQAGYTHLALVEHDPDAAATLRANRPDWPVWCQDVRDTSLAGLAGQVDVLSGGVPCPPFSIAGHRAGPDDARDLFPDVLRLTAEAVPRVVMIENVAGLLSSRFQGYRAEIVAAFTQMGYQTVWGTVDAVNYGVPQGRVRSILIAAKPDVMSQFDWPVGDGRLPVTVGEALGGMMGAGGWAGAPAWAGQANRVAPTIVGGSTKHGGADLGPSRTRKLWQAMRVKATSVMIDPPGPDFPEDGTPYLTIAMLARLQGFPEDWVFTGTKRKQHRQVGNAFPPPVSRVFAERIRTAISLADQTGR